MVIFSAYLLFCIMRHKTQQIFNGAELSPAGLLEQGDGDEDPLPEEDEQ